MVPCLTRILSSCTGRLMEVMSLSLASTPQRSGTRTVPLNPGLSSSFWRQMGLNFHQPCPREMLRYPGRLGPPGAPMHNVGLQHLQHLTCHLPLPHTPEGLNPSPNASLLSNNGTCGRVQYVQLGSTVQVRPSACPSSHTYTHPLSACPHIRLPAQVRSATCPYADPSPPSHTSTHTSTLTSTHPFTHRPHIYSPFTHPPR